MGSIKCLNCRNEIITISGMECPHCKVQLSHVKIAFLSYLGPEDSLTGYQRSYKLVLLKSIFTLLRDGQELSVQKVTEIFRDYYLARVRKGLPADKDVDSRIGNIEKSSLQDIWLIIQANPLTAIQKHGFLRVSGEGLNGEFVLQKGLNNFTNKELENLICLLDQKLGFYYKKIGSRAIDWTYKASVQPEEVTIKEDDVGACNKAGVMQFGVREKLRQDKNPSNYEGNQHDEAISKTTELAGSKVPLEYLSLSNRTFNVLKRGRIDTLGQLAKAFDDGALKAMRNVGKTVVEEITGVLNNPVIKICGEDFSCSGEVSATSVSGIGDKQIAEVFEGGVFNLFVQHCRLTGRNQIKDLVGFKYEELLTIKGFGVKKISAVLEMLKEIERLTTNESAETSTSSGTLNLLVSEKKIYIHPTNRKCGVSILRLVGITNLAITALTEASYDTLGDLNGIDCHIFIEKVKYRNVDALLKALEQFVNPFEEVLDEILNEYAKDKAFEVFLRRAEGQTLQSVAEEYGITRERVRQICNNTIKKLDAPCSAAAEMLMDENGGGWFRKEQLYGLVTNLRYAKALSYIYEESDNYYCIHSSDLFLLRVAFTDAEERLHALAADIVGDGINIFESADKIEDALETAGFGFISSSDFLGLLIDLEYTFYGDYALKDKKSYGWLCARIVEEEYPDGISNNEGDMTRLRELVHQRYGDLALPENNRSAYARLCEHLILRGRSKYIAPARVYVDESILTEIKNYIEKSQQKEIFYSELFAEFEGLLLMMTNIDNAQFLHGVLRYYFPADYSYSRDYLSKDSGTAGQSLADRITAYISSTGGAVSKKDILRQFSGISEIVLLNAAYKFTGLLQWEYGYFNSLDNLNLNEYDIQRIDKTISSLLEENDGYCSEAMLYAKAQREFRDVLEKSSIKNGLNLFYTAQELFSGKYSFRSPHIARNGRFESLNVINIARNSLGDHMHIKASEFFRLAKRYMWSEVTASMAFTEIEKEYIRINADEYLHKSLFVLNDVDRQQAKVLIDEEAGSNWFLSLQTFMDREEVLSVGLEVNEFVMESLATEYELGWHVVSPRMKDRRYQRGILVRDSVAISSYDELISCVLKEQNIDSISEADLLGFLQIHSLVYSHLPKDLQQSEHLVYNGGIYKVQ